LCHFNLASLRSDTGDPVGATSEAEQSLATQLSLGLVEHPATLRTIHTLSNYYELSGEPYKAALLRSGNVSDLLPMIKQIEAEHWGWVAQDPALRYFEPRSFFKA
jgi:hypothetical protein